MNQESALPSYTELTTILQKIEPNCHVSQIHGLLCGYLCRTAGGTIDCWKNVFPNAKKSRKGEEILNALYESTYHQLSEFSFEFALVLPDDESDINLRAESLGLWCQGFVTGLEPQDITEQKEASPELKEALDDVIEISQLTFGDIAANEEDETAYFELVEYVRLSALLIFHELNDHPIEKDIEEDDILH